MKKIQSTDLSGQVIGKINSNFEEAAQGGSALPVKNIALTDVEWENYTYTTNENVTASTIRIMGLIDHGNYNAITVKFKDGYIGIVNSWSEDVNKPSELEADCSTFIGKTELMSSVLYNIPSNAKRVGIWLKDESGSNTLYPANIADYIDYIELSYANEEVEDDFRALTNVRKGASDLTGTLTLLHFSDIHADGERLKNIVKFMEKYPVTDALCTGDHYVRGRTDEYTYWEDAGAGKILDCIGNHDTLYASPLPTAQQIYERHIGAHVAEWGVVQPDNASTSYLNYYYKDYDLTRAKVRLIVLDCMAYDTAQNTWFTNVLTDALNNGYSVIVAEHYQGGIPSNDIETNLNDANLDGYLGGSSGDMEVANTSAVTAVGDFIDNGGDFVTWICGHTHDSRFSHIQADSRQLCVVVSCQATNAYAGCRAYNRDLGTPREDMFNVYSIDTTSKVIKVMRVGAHTNILMRSCKRLCYDYANNVLLSSE